MPVRVLSLLFVLVAFVSSLARAEDYSFDERKISPKQIPLLASVPKTVSIKVTAGASSEEQKLWNKYLGHKYYGTDKKLAEAIVTQLTKEFSKAGLKTAPQAERSLEIAVKGCNTEVGSYNTAATIDFVVTCGDGKSYPFTARNSCPGLVYRAYNGAVHFSVVNILNSPELIAYLKAP